MSGYRIVSKELRSLSPWTTLATKKVAVAFDADLREYHSLVVSDYVTVLAVTADDKIPLVRQYRPALERTTLELPGGLRDGDRPGVRSASLKRKQDSALQDL